MTIKLDLRTDLAKVTPETLGPLGACTYTAPCAIGAMMTPDERKRVAESHDGDGDTTSIGILVLAGTVTLPADQLSDFKALQSAFDRAHSDGSRARFFTTLASMKEKYSA